MYHLLGLRTYLTTGGSKRRAPGRFARGDKGARSGRRDPHGFRNNAAFHRVAETVHFDDLVRLGSNCQGARKAGKLRIEGKEYVVEDGDVMEFPFQRLTDEFRTPGSLACASRESRSPFRSRFSRAARQKRS